MGEEYTWSENLEDGIWNHGRFDSEEECIKDAINKGKKPGEKILIGLCEKYVPHLNIDDLIEQVSDDAYYWAGEAAEEWPAFEYGRGYIDADILQEKMDKAFYEWLEETGQEPGFYRIIPSADPVIIPDAKPTEM